MEQRRGAEGKGGRDDSMAHPAGNDGQQGDQSRPSEWASCNRASGLPPVREISGGTTDAATDPASSRVASAVLQTGQFEHADPGQLAPRIAAGQPPPGQQDCDRVVPEPPSGECNRRTGFRVDPVQIVDDEQQRAIFGVCCRQGERRDCNQESISAHRGFGPSERGRQRVPLSGG